MSSGPQPWLISTDQMGHKLELTAPPQRIVSLVPSQTELLFDLGLEDRVVGITKFCVHPGHWRKSKTIVGGTKNFQLDVIERLRPDLIIGNKEENYPEGILSLQKKFPVWMSDIISFEDALAMIKLVSQITDRQSRGEEVLERIKNAFDNLKLLPSIKTLYVIWKKPWMGAACDTFIGSLMEKIGLINVLDKEERYPELTSEKIKELDPAVVLLSSEPFPFSDKHVKEMNEILPKAKVQLVDGEMFSWYGSRLALAPAYFNSIRLPS